MSMGPLKTEGHAVRYGADAEQFLRLGLTYSTGGRYGHRA